MNEAEREEWSRALATGRALELGTVPAYSLVALEPDDPPARWLVVLPRPSDASQDAGVRVLQHAGRTAGSEPPERLVFVVCTPLTVALALLTDPALRDALRTHRDWLALLSWRRGVRVWDNTGADNQPASDIIE